MPKIEKHTLRPFFPKNARLLMLGAFPPPEKRWCMDFFYPNFRNDMWRIFGLVFFGDKNEFIIREEKKFDAEKIKLFLSGKGIAVFDTAVAAVRLKDNASDKFLQIETPLDLASALASLPSCRTVATTGTKAAYALADILGSEVPARGECQTVLFSGRTLGIYRMPSSSRALPMNLAQKAAEYAKMFSEIGLL